MAANQQESRLSLKLLIDEKSNRVVAAEAHKEFVDILFSFLTLPMGTIIRVTSRAGTPNVSCTCGNKIAEKITAGDLGTWVNEDGFLLKGRTMFIISDDLQIRPACPIFLAQLLSNLGLSEIDGIREMRVEVSKEQVICLLARSLVSESPLSDVFLPNPTKHDTKLPNPETERTFQTSETTEQTETPTLNLQIAEYHNCKKQPLKLDELIERNNLIDPRPNQNFAVEPSLFIVLDNLDVKPLSSVSSFLILKELKVPFSDIKEQVITVGMKEALSLLKAALTSPSSALTNGLASFWQKKQDA
nr:DUF674 family protein [Ipomoea batatas]